MTGTLRNDDPWSEHPGLDRLRDFEEADGSGDEPRTESENSSGDGDGVGDAYRVADENMREAAWRNGFRHQRSYDARYSGGYGPRPDFSFGSRSSNYSSPFGFNSPFGYGGRPSDGMLEQLMRGYMDMMGLLGTVINGLTRAPYPQYSPYQRPFENRGDADFRFNAPPSHHSRSLAVNVEVASNQPNQVILDLKALPPRAALAVEPLRGEGGKPEIREVRFETSGDRYVLKIRVPDAHPAGIYSGAILNAANREPCGTLAVQVSPAASRSSKRL